MVLTMNLRSFVNVKRMTASMRSSGSGESLILYRVKNKSYSAARKEIERESERKRHTQQKHLGGQDIANTQGSESAPRAKLATRDA